MAEIYLDNNATTRPLESVVECMARVSLQHYGNPSSIHSTGHSASSLVEDSREKIANTIKAEPRSLVFTSGATESNNLILNSVLTSDTLLITSRIEHSSVFQLATQFDENGGAVRFLNVLPSGVVDLEDLATCLTNTNRNVVVAIQWANSETGIIQPVLAISDLCQAHGAHFHCDAVQAFGRLTIDVNNILVDSLAITGHKIHGPKGVGALYVRKIRTLAPQIVGGDQESGLRSGTENVAGIVGFAEAVKVRHSRLANITQYMATLISEFINRVKDGFPAVIENGHGDRVSNTINLQLPGIDGQALVVLLDQQGLMCSQSSACTNQRPEPSRVLRSMGLSEEEAYSSIRFSVSEFTTTEEICEAADVLLEALNMQQKFMTMKGVA